MHTLGKKIEPKMMGNCQVSWVEESKFKSWPSDIKSYDLSYFPVELLTQLTAYIGALELTSMRSQKHMGHHIAFRNIPLVA
jgi:hypothetical protein